MTAPSARVPDALTPVGAVHLAADAAVLAIRAARRSVGLALDELDWQRARLAKRLSGGKGQRQSEQMNQRMG